MVVRFGTADISGNGRTLDVEETADEVDVTTYGSTDKEFVAGMVDRTATMEILDDSEASAAIRSVLQIGSSNSLTWFPKGTASGNQKHQAGTAVVLSRSRSYPYDDAVVFTTNFRISGAVPETTANGAGT